MDRTRPACIAIRSKAPWIARVPRAVNTQAVQAERLRSVQAGRLRSMQAAFHAGETPALHEWCAALMRCL